MFIFESLFDNIFMIKDSSSEKKCSRNISLSSFEIFMKYVEFSKYLFLFLSIVFISIFLLSGSLSVNVTLI